MCVASRTKTESFNGAAADQRRKPEEARLQKIADDASMGPPLISGGNADVLPAGVEERPGFNGAAADQRRKRGSVAAIALALCPASMGPPLISGGNFNFSPQIVTPARASMGPPLISGGNITCSVPNTSTIALQWGRR